VLVARHHHRLDRPALGGGETRAGIGRRPAQPRVVGGGEREERAGRWQPDARGTDRAGDDVGVESVVAIGGDGVPALVVAHEEDVRLVDPGQLLQPHEGVANLLLAQGVDDVERRLGVPSEPPSAAGFRRSVRALETVGNDYGVALLGEPTRIHPGRALHVRAAVHEHHGRQSGLGGNVVERTPDLRVAQSAVAETGAGRVNPELGTVPGRRDALGGQRRSGRRCDGQEDEGAPHAADVAPGRRARKHAAATHAAASRAKPCSRSATRSSASSSPAWMRNVGPPGFHGTAVRTRAGKVGMIRLS
jgi:hypothetical protein